MHRWGVAATMLVGAVVAEARAEESVEALVARAVAERKAGNLAAAGALFGEAAAAAHEAEDLVLEMSVAEALADAVRGLPLGGSKGSGRGVATGTSGEGEAAPATPGRADLLAEVLAKLDSKRLGAFVSAPALARRLLLDATASGHFGHVEAARKAAASPGAKAGAAGTAMAAYGDALALHGKGKSAEADSKLQSVVRQAFAESWGEIAVHGSVELAARRSALGDAAGAAAALGTLTGHLAAGTGGADHDGASSLVETRLKGASADVLAPWTAYTAKRNPVGSSVGAAGGAGGEGGRSTSESPFGRAMRTSRGEPVISAKRTPKGFECRVAWNPAYKVVQPFLPTAKHLSEGGAVLLLHERSVGMRFVDPTGIQGLPGESTVVPACAALYPLAEGETFALLRTGVVSVSAR